MKRILWVLLALVMFLNIPMDTFAANTNSQYELKLNGVTEVREFDSRIKEKVL